MKNILLLLLTFTIGTSYSQVYKFRTSLTDIEVSGKTVRSIFEICYHTFDFDNQQVIYEGVNLNGEHVKVSYPIERSYQNGNYTDVVVNGKGMRKIWFSTPTWNLGYDLSNGNTRKVYYGATRIR